MAAAGAEPQPFPNLWQGLGMALAYLAVGSWLNALMAVVAEGLHLPPWIAILPAHVLGFPLALAFGVWLGRLDLWDILAFHRVRPGIWLPLLVAHLGFFILIQAFAHGVEFGLDRLLPEALKAGLLKESGPMEAAAGPVLGLVFASAALPEEVLFRGLILRGFLGHHRPWVAIWLSTALFVAAHGNPLQFPVALMLGATAGWYFQATGSLWPGLMAHGLHNLFVGLLLDPGAMARGSLVATPRPTLPWLLDAPVLAALGLLWLRREFGRPEPQRLGVLDRPS